ncbi:MAG: YiiD C-terminal domain-containing protein [Motiliproteus sp.]
MSQDYSQLLQQFETKLREDIPLVNHMGFQQLQYSGDSLTIEAQLEPNHNDKGTAFAGSLSACGNLCGWGLITLLLEQQDKAYDVVIRDSRLEYFLPVTQDFKVTAGFAESADIDTFIDKLKTKGKARMDVVVQVIERGELCFRLSGAYVALERKQWV